MKIKILISAIFFSCLLFTGCEKDAFDYRNAYVGDWKFEVENSYFNMLDSTYSDTTFTYHGDIKYGSGPEDIVIHYAEDIFQSLKMRDNGELYHFPTPYSSGKFEEADKIHLLFYSGGHGGGTTQQINGKRD